MGRACSPRSGSMRRRRRGRCWPAGAAAAGRCPSRPRAAATRGRPRARRRQSMKGRAQAKTSDLSRATPNVPASSSDYWPVLPALQLLDVHMRRFLRLAASANQRHSGYRLKSACTIDIRKLRIRDTLRRRAGRSDSQIVKRKRLAALHQLPNAIPEPDSASRILQSLRGPTRAQPSISWVSAAIARVSLSRFRRRRSRRRAATA